MSTLDITIVLQHGWDQHPASDQFQLELRMAILLQVLLSKTLITTVMFKISTALVRCRLIVGDNCSEDMSFKPRACDTIAA